MPHQCTTCERTFPDGSKEMLSGCPDCGGNKFQFQPSGQSNDDGSIRRTSDSTSPPEPPADVDDGGVTGTVAEAAGTVRDWVGGDEPDRSRSGPSIDDTAEDSGETDWPAVGRRDPTDDPTRNGGATSEDTAQASARSDIVDPSDLPTDSGNRTNETQSPNRPQQTDSGIQSDHTDSRTRSDSTEPTTAPPEPQYSDEGRSDRPPGDGIDEPDSSPFTGSGSADEDTPDLDELRDELNEQFESIRIVSPGQYELNLMELYDRDEYIISLLEDGRYAIEVPEAWRDET